MDSISSNLNSPLAEISGLVFGWAEPTPALSQLLSVSQEDHALPSPHWPLQQSCFRGLECSWADSSHSSFKQLHAKRDSAGGWSGCNLQGSQRKLSPSKSSCVGSCLRCYPLQRWADRTQALPSPGFWQLPWDCRDALGISASIPSFCCSPQA